jgi:gluconolactonase
MWRNGKTSAVIRDIPHTNGLAFSPDEKILYANGSRERFVRAYDVEPDGTLTNGRLFINLNSDPRPGITDGMKVDSKGNLWESGPGGIWIISPQGKPLGHIQVPELVANLAFGDADYKTLYIAARTSVYKNAREHSRHSMRPHHQPAASCEEIAIRQSRFDRLLQA